VDENPESSGRLHYAELPTTFIFPWFFITSHQRCFRFQLFEQV